MRVQRDYSRFEVTRVGLGEKSDRPPFFARSTRATDPVDVAHRALREIVVDDEFDAFKVDPSPHDVRADERPHFALGKLFHGLVALGTRAFGVDAVGRQPVEEQLGRQLFRARDRLDKDEHRRRELTERDERTEREEFVVLRVDELQLLRDRARRRLPVKE